jgi:hypothetical protein
MPAAAVQTHHRRQFRAPTKGSTSGIETTRHKGAVMNIHVAIGPLAALIAGSLILAVPRLLNYIVALYLIIIGIIGLFGAGGHL